VVYVFVDNHAGVWGHVKAGSMDCGHM